MTYDELIKNNGTNLVRTCQIQIITEYDVVLDLGKLIIRGWSSYNALKT
jgi:hypothetical protein